MGLKFLFSILILSNSLFLNATEYNVDVILKEMHLTKKQTSLAIQKILQNIKNNSAYGSIYFPSGIYYINQPIKVFSNISIRGDGYNKSIIKLQQNANTEMIISENFKKLKNTNKWLYTEKVPIDIEIRDIQINGNKSYQKQNKSCVKLYAKSYKIKNILILNCSGNGFYSEGGDKSGQQSWKDLPEGLISNLHISNCEQNGFVFKGPHDIYIESLFVNKCETGIVFKRKRNKYNGSADINLIHTYDNNNGFYSNVPLRINTLISESNHNHGVIIDGEQMQISKIQIYNNEKIDFHLTRQAKFNIINNVILTGLKSKSIQIEGSKNIIDNFLVRASKNLTINFFDYIKNNYINIYTDNYYECKVPKYNFIRCNKL